jgi:hypothetical protein
MTFLKENKRKQKKTKEKENVNENYKIENLMAKNDHFFE